MKEIKEKPSDYVPKEKVAGNIPKAALKKAWTEAKEKRNVPMDKQAVSDEQGAYSDSAQTGENIAERTTAVVSDTLAFSYK